jgi:hypothetical protein
MLTGEANVPAPLCCFHASNCQSHCEPDGSGNEPGPQHGSTLAESASGESTSAAPVKDARGRSIDVDLFKVVDHQAGHFIPLLSVRIRLLIAPNPWIPRLTWKSGKLAPVRVRVKRPNDPQSLRGAIRGPAEIDATGEAFFRNRELKPLGGFGAAAYPAALFSPWCARADVCLRRADVAILTAIVRRKSYVPTRPVVGARADPGRQPRVHEGNLG